MGAVLILSCKDGEEKNDDEKMLFHGTGVTKPSKIYTSEQGFDFRYSSHGLWGTGTYFAEKVSYSHNYSFRYFDDVRQILLARVLTVETYRCLPCSDLRKPPNKNQVDDDTGDGLFDSVSG